MSSGAVRRGGWSWEGRRALVTGASAGLGVEFARALAARGVDLVLTARREDRLRTLASEIERDHRRHVAIVPADLARPGAASELWTRAREHGAVDILINNAGFGAQGTVADIPIERQLQMLTVNCEAVMVLAWLAAREMRDRGGGGIINLASIAAFQPVPRLAAYGASKAFVLSLSEAMHVELRPAGVRVVALSPGRTPTEFQDVAGTGSTAGAFGVRSPRRVVESGLRALELNRATAVPGIENWIVGYLARALPRGLVAGAAGTFIRRAARKG